VGAEGLGDEELVAIVLGTGTARDPVGAVAARVLARTADIGGLERLGARRLAEIPGVGPGKAARLVAAVELGKRARGRPLPPGSSVGSSRDIDAALRGRLAGADQEHFLALPLDAKNRVLGELRLAMGGLTSCPVAPGDAFRAILREAAVSVIFVHNHPSGDPAPSADDIALTGRLERAGQLLGVHVLDHVIIAGEGYFSFLDAGLLPHHGAASGEDAA
jgi:DNA repair protein RadC